MANDFFSRYAVGGAQRPDSFTGMQPEFLSALQLMFENAPPDIQQQLRVGSGFRSPQRQTELWQGALKKYGSPEAARKWVAPPGKSQHNHGNAADLKYLNDSARQWAHQNAAKYGLAFPLSNEDWHVELAGARGGHAPAAAVSAPQAQAMAGAPAPGAKPAAFGDVVAPRQAPNFGAAIANWQQRRQQRDEEEAIEKQRRALLFSDLGSMYG